MGANKWAVSDYVTGTFIVASIEQKQGTRGGFFLAGKLQNKYGVIPFKRWNATLEQEGITKNDVVEVGASVDAYEGVMQLIVTRWEIAAIGTYAVADLIPHSPIESDVLWSEMLSHIERIGEAGLREWLAAFVTDREKAIRQAPAAIAMHHAYAGGLMEHINGLCRAAEQIGLVYDVDLDVLIAGCVLHDIGKIFELESFPSLDYTPIGNLVGHVCCGISEVSKSLVAWNAKARAAAIKDRTPGDRTLEEVPQRQRYHLMHIIASHHGLAEHGAARPPATLEAMIFHHLDMIDSQAWMLTQHVAADQSDGEFTSLHRGLGARLWKRAGGEAEEPDGDQ